VLHLINRANERANDLVGESWAANFCKICPAYNFGETKTLDRLATHRVKLYEGMASAFLAQLLTIAEDDGLYNHFVENVKVKQEETFALNVF